MCVGVYIHVCVCVRTFYYAVSQEQRHNEDGCYGDGYQGDEHRHLWLQPVI